MAWGSITAANQEEMEPVLRAFYRLRNHDDLQTILNWLREKRATMMERNSIEQDEVAFRWNQGQIQVLAGILNVNDTAEDVLAWLMLQKQERSLS